MPDGASGTPNSVAPRGMAFSRKNMTTKVGAARISGDQGGRRAARHAAAQAASGEQQAERQPDGDGDGRDLEIHRHAVEEARQEVGRQPVEQRAHAATPASTWRRSRQSRSLPHSQTTIITTAV